MENFIGTKALLAKPMTKEEYCNYRDWRVPENEDPDQEGYLVEYLDGGAPNHPDHKGYISWSPKDVFERSYKPSGTYLDRLKIEQTDLNDKFSKLDTFFKNETGPVKFLDETNLKLLKRQRSVMADYSEILDERIKRAEYMQNGQ